MDADFLADLEDLSDEEQEANEGLEAAEEDEGGDNKMEDLSTLNYDDLTAVAKLTSEPHYQSVMQRVRAALQEEHDPTAVRTSLLLEDDPTYKLLVDCNKLAVDIDNEIVIVHNFIRDKYRLKFPELESLVLHPVEYAKVVSRIGNEMDLTQVELEDLLPAASVMVVTVTATTTSGKQLSPEVLTKTEQGCAMALQLDEDKQQIIRFVESRMHQIAPNLSAAIGSEVAARLMGVAGGLMTLSKMPACNVQVLGAKRKTLAGYSSSTVQPHQGFIYGSALIQATPPGLKSKAARLVGAKCTLLARIDAYGQDPEGQTGQQFRAEMEAKILKWQEPPPAKTVKPLDKPDAEAKKRRGGRRLRKMKERYGLTDMRKAANRMNFDFNKAEDEYIDGDEIVGLGTINKEGSGRLRLVASQQKVKLNAKQEKKYRNRLMAAGTATSGLSSTLAFTPVQGFELATPTNALTEADKGRSGTESYFSEFGGFRSLQKPPPKA